ncbi:MAG: hypothetical protein HYU66_18040 [Armatimonadetes bacterium]|nr:hypothetical protein [Armatimonadota bacterium]
MSTKWDDILAADRLGLSPDLVKEVVPLPRADADGHPVLEVRVALSPKIRFEDLTWDLLSPVQRAISDRVDQEPDAGYLWVRFFTLDDWATLGKGDFEEVTDDAAG